MSKEKSKGQSKKNVHKSGFLEEKLLDPKFLNIQGFIQDLNTIAADIIDREELTIEWLQEWWLDTLRKQISPQESILSALGELVCKAEITNLKGRTIREVTHVPDSVDKIIKYSLFVLVDLSEIYTHAWTKVYDVEPDLEAVERWYKQGGSRLKPASKESYPAILEFLNEPIPGNITGKPDTNEENKNIASYMVGSMPPPVIYPPIEVLEHYVTAFRLANKNAHELRILADQLRVEVEQNIPLTSNCQLKQKDKKCEENKPFRVKGKNLTSKESQDIKAVAIFVDHPDWTMGQIAEEIGRNRAAMYRLPKFRILWKAEIERRKRNIPGGYKNEETGEMEAYER